MAGSSSTTTLPNNRCEASPHPQDWLLARSDQGDHHSATERVQRVVIATIERAAATAWSWLRRRSSIRWSQRPPEARSVAYVGSTRDLTLD